ncbi:Glucan endo-1,3-alpha-glucosidase agn1 [Neolecta irregularis DAH-3]|uniref:Glucan endo-1,3-alpha-glucosidase agn1 n=1 Tax=Neolecta irregularis (strain DAH-3) TaxID=1198029 RepID=A0A1U7LH56_NEOID|nr:Glucan endo-1,3-alpha-glucosidase agn1 [Neolecta irregularis DAH-3]|eukprot:OLL21882.1 Glucan endo-1,3-alpha-glucosidase agn1 [Neolecta irregularis DAH-3]
MTIYYSFFFLLTQTILAFPVGHRHHLHLNRKNIDVQVIVTACLSLSQQSITPPVISSTSRASVCGTKTINHSTVYATAIAERNSPVETVVQRTTGPVPNNANPTPTRATIPNPVTTTVPNLTLPVSQNFGTQTPFTLSPSNIAIITEPSSMSIPIKQTIASLISSSTQIATTLATNSVRRSTISSSLSSSSSSSSDGYAEKQKRYVFAHFMMGNVYSYTEEDFRTDLHRAMNMGIDAFALNLGPDEWMPARVSAFFQAAKSFNVRLFFSFDMSVMNSSEELVGYVKKYASDSSYFLYQNQVFVSTFSGQDQMFGSNNVRSGWKTAFIDPLENDGLSIYFIPCWTAMDATEIYSMPFVDGAFSWDAWTNKISRLDEKYTSLSLKTQKTYMSGWSPWFFTHLSSKNWIYPSELLFHERWMEIIESSQIFTEIITWNDYGESTYVSDIRGSLPQGSEEFVTGFDHSIWCDLAKYYIQWYKSGSQPVIEFNEIYYWYRTHSKSATAQNDPFGLPENADNASDDIIVIALLKEPGKLTVTTGSTWNCTEVKAGLQVLNLPFEEGKQVIEFVGDSSGVTISGIGDVEISNSIEKYNFNAFVGKITA